MLHEIIHIPILRLRKLLRLGEHGCDRCKGYESRRQARQKEEDGTISSLTSYAVRQATVFEQVARRQIRPTYGANRQFFQYNSLALGKDMGYVTNLFNAYCAENGVQCTVTQDVLDFSRLFHFTNVSDRTVRIYHLGEVRVIAPGESVTMKVKDSDYDLSDQSRLPMIVAINPEGA